ncbi:MAG: methyltransferase family protein [Petrotogales bacterium]
MWFYIGLGIVILFSFYCWFGIKNAYEKGKILPLHVSVIIWTVDTIHFLLVLFASLNSIWPIPFNNIFMLIAGIFMGGIGLIIMLTGIIEFHSFKRMSGLDSSNLITSGIYKWSRNPQYTGWFFVLIGISLMGRSALALLLTMAFIIGIHLYNIKLEEPYLERVFNEEYHRYKLLTPRYIGMPKKKRK